MYHSPSKRQQLIKRIISYGFMTVAVIVLVVVLVFVMLGYRFNQNDGRIEQGGLVQFDSQPNGATITIDGQTFGTKSPSKTTLTAASHAITMSRSGYQTWQKNVNLSAGAVLWLNYARLIPDQIKPESVSNFAVVSSTAASPDQKWMAIKEKPETANIQLADLSGDTVKTTQLDLPAESYTQPDTGKTQSFTLQDWDAGSRYVIVKHAYNDNQIEWLVVDTRDMSSTKNVTKLLDVQASKLVFSGNDSHILYAQIGTDVRKIDLGAATLSRPLVTHVADFSIFDQTTITYSTLLDSATGTRTVGYYEDGKDSPVTVATYKDDGTLPLHFALGRYFGDMYEAIDYGDNVKIYTGNLPTATNSSQMKLLTTVTMPGGAQYLSIKTEGRFVIMQNGGTFKTYDLELKKTAQTTLKGVSPVTKKLGWIDGYMPWSDRDGMLRLYEFDGANQHDIMPVIEGFDVTLSPNSRYIYGIQKMADGMYHLERARLILS
jgi:hypothetical protein